MRLCYSLSEGVRPWQSIVGPPSVRPTGCCKHPLRFLKCQSPETMEKNEMWENPAWLERKARGVLVQCPGTHPLPVLASKRSFPGTKRGRWLLTHSRVSFSLSIPTARQHLHPGEPLALAFFPVPLKHAQVWGLSLQCLLSSTTHPSRQRPGSQTLSDAKTAVAIVTMTVS